MRLCLSIESRRYNTRLLHLVSSHRPFPPFLGTKAFCGRRTPVSRLIPSVFFSRSPDTLNDLPGDCRMPRLRPPLSLVVSIIEYFLAAATVANNFELAIRIALRSVLA